MWRNVIWEIQTDSFKRIIPSISSTKSTTFAESNAMCQVSGARIIFGTWQLTVGTWILALDSCHLGLEKCHVSGPKSQNIWHLTVDTCYYTFGFSLYTSDLASTCFFCYKNAQFVQNCRFVKTLLTFRQSRNQQLNFERKYFERSNPEMSAIVFTLFQIKFYIVIFPFRHLR